MGYTKYDEVNDSGVPWLQEKPSHWRMKRLKFSTNLINNKVSAEESVLPYIGLEHIESWTGRKVEGEISNSEGVASAYLAGDVLFGKLRPYLAKVYLALQHGLISSEALVVRSKDELLAEFLKYYMLSRDFVNTVDSSTYGSKMPRASWDFIGNLPVLLPTIEEQQAIVRFLDDKTAQIDELIARQNALLGKLVEKSAAMINLAVTKGLDPIVPMKDSGVAWLGMIPAHWDALPLRRLIRAVKTGTTPSGVNEFHFDDDGLAWIRPGDFSDQIFIKSAEKRLSEEGVAEVRVFPPFTVMHVGIGATIGKVGVSTEQSSCNQQINAIVCNERLHNVFAAYFLRAIREYIVKCGKYTTLPIINQDETKALSFTAPPVSEQIKISEYLVREGRRIEEQQKKIYEVIARLQEYRSVLITNAVTGKIDVRGLETPRLAETAAP